MTNFQTQYDGLLTQAKQNKVRYQTAITEAEKGLKENRLTPQGANQMKRDAQKQYDTKRGELRKAYNGLVTTERDNLARGLAQPPANVLASDWRGITRETHEAESVAPLIDRAVMFADSGLARGITARSYRRFVETGESLDHLGPLYELDSQVASVLDFETSHGVLRSPEQKVMGPFNGQD